MDVAPVDMEQLIKEILVYNSDDIEARGLVTEISVPENLPLCNSDGKRIKQIIFNLLNNAVKFTFKGKI